MLEQLLFAALLSLRVKIGSVCATIANSYKLGSRSEVDELKDVVAARAKVSQGRRNAGGDCIGYCKNNTGLAIQVGSLRCDPESQTRGRGYQPNYTAGLVREPKNTISDQADRKRCTSAPPRGFIVYSSSKLSRGRSKLEVDDAVGIADWIDI